MVQKDLILENENGLHMRPGKLFVQEAKKQACTVSIIHKERTCDAKSLVQLLKLGIGKGHSITLVCNGDNEEQSLENLISFIGTLKE